MKLRSFLWFMLVLLIASWMVGGCMHEPIEEMDIDDPGGGDTTVVEDPCEPDVIYFERDILPIFTTSCAFSGCHNAESAEDGVILISYESVMASDIVRPFRLDNSDLYEVITDDDEDDRMPKPPAPRLSSEEIQLIANWILQGATNEICDWDMQCKSENISYLNEVRPILDSGCLSCHNSGNPSGGVVLDNFNGVRAAAESGRLLGAISWTGPYQRMPLGGLQLSDCKIQQIETWINEGMKNN